MTIQSRDEEFTNMHVYTYMHYKQEVIHYHGHNNYIIYYSLTISAVIDRWLLYKLTLQARNLIMKLFLYISWLHAVTTIYKEVPLQHACRQ